MNSKHSRWSCLRRLPPLDFEILHLPWYAPKYIKDPKMLNIRGKPNIYKIQGLLFWTNLPAITEECFLWLLLCSLPFIYAEQKANNIFLPCSSNCLQIVQDDQMIRLETRFLFPTEHIDPSMRILLPVLATEESINYKIPESFLLSSIQIPREKKIQYRKILVLQSSMMKMASFISLAVIPRTTPLFFL